MELECFRVKIRFQSHSAARANCMSKTIFENTHCATIVASSRRSKRILTERNIDFTLLLYLHFCGCATRLIEEGKSRRPLHIPRTDYSNTSRDVYKEVHIQQEINSRPNYITKQETVSIPRLTCPNRPNGKASQARKPPTTNSSINHSINLMQPN